MTKCSILMSETWLEIGRCRWSEHRWVRSGVSGGWWLRWRGRLWQCDISDITPSPKGGSWRPQAAAGVSTASGCGTIWMSAVEVLEQHGIQNIVSPLVHNPPSQPGTWTGYPAAASPRCSQPGRPMVGLGFLEEEACRVPWVLMRKEKGV